MRSALSVFASIHWALLTECMLLSYGVWPLNTCGKYPNYKISIGLTLRIPSFGKNPWTMNILISHFTEDKYKTNISK